MFANPILTESAGVNRHLFFSTFNYEWDRLKGIGPVMSLWDIGLKAYA